MTSSPRPAFSLIELLVVTAIIALLIGLLSPSLSAARDSARGTACQSNIRQIQLGVLMYMQNMRDYLPGGGYAAGA